LQLHQYFMKNLSIIHILFFLLLFILQQCAFGQDYVVTLKGDTIHGDVKLLAFANEERVQVVPPGQKKQSFAATQVKSVHHSDAFFKPVRTPKKYSLMKVVIPGYLSLYAFQQENQIGYDGLFLQKNDGQSLEVPNLTFKKTIKNFLSDCSNVVTKVENGELGKSDLQAIVTSYNECIADKTEQSMKASSTQVLNNNKLQYWNALEASVSSLQDLTTKSDALEMIKDVKGKIDRNENVPNFLVEGLKSSLSQSTEEVKAKLQSALDAIGK
jgi:hypothetical protein